MYTEFEATYTNIDRSDIKSRLIKAGARLIKPEFMMKRVTFNLPTSTKLPGSWLRVRDEGDRVTMSLKVIDGAEISDQREICLTVSDFEQAVELLETIGAQRKAFQESRREIWQLDEVEVCLDEWPYLEPFVEVEGSSEAAVKQASQKLGLDYHQAQFCAVGTLYAKKYGLPEETVNNQTARITFSDPNPFVTQEAYAK